MLFTIPMSHPENKPIWLRQSSCSCHQRCCQGPQDYSKTTAPSWCSAAHYGPSELAACRLLDPPPPSPGLPPPPAASYKTAPHKAGPGLLSLTELIHKQRQRTSCITFPCFLNSSVEPLTELSTSRRTSLLLVRSLTATCPKSCLSYWLLVLAIIICTETHAKKLLTAPSTTLTA
jgi:hypothetical protein